MADIAVATRLREKSETDYQRELEVAQHQSSKKIDRVEGALTAQEQELDHKRSELEMREQQLAAQQTALEAERKAREEAEAKAAAALSSLEEIAKVQEDKRGLVITLSGAVLFKTGDSALLPIAEQQLQKVAEALMEQDESKIIRVEGHTDDRGSSGVNYRLSLSRAQSVRAFLVSQGVKPDRIVAIGKGEDTPIANNKTAEGRANNRRVEIVVGAREQ